MLHILEIRQVLPTTGWKAVLSGTKEPFYFTEDVDFWLVCRVVDMDELSKFLRNKLAYGIPLGKDKETIEAKAFDGVFAAEVCDLGGCGDLDLYEDLSNFVRIIPSSYPEEELKKEFARPPKNEGANL